jgi:predicted nucleic acid-binding protein
LSGYLIDTSVFVAVEQGRPLGDPPAGMGHVSVATLTELMLGVRRAPTENDRRGRSTTVARARRFIPLPYDEPVAEQLADILAAAARHERRAASMDAIIAATSLVHDLTVWTHENDFDVIAELVPRLCVHRA